MQDFDRLITRFRQFGGIRLVWQYAKMGVLWTGVKEIIKCVIKGRSFKTVYPVITNKIDQRLIAELSPAITPSALSQISLTTTDINASDNVWFCWLQGIDNAPEMVKVCLESQRRLYGNRVVVLDDTNYKQWIGLPDYIEVKYRNGLIPGALFSDMLRLQLLITYGGTWIDSTVFVSPITNESEPVLKKAMKRIDESELFIYRYFQNGKTVGMSNWFIHSAPGNPLLTDVRDMLFAYWKKYNCTVDYYIFHLLFTDAAKRYHEMIAKMPKANSFHAVMLRDRLAADYNQQWWTELITNVPFHKINYRLEAKARSNPHSYWNHILHSYAQ